MSLWKRLFGKDDAEAATSKEAAPKEAAPKEDPSKKAPREEGTATATPPFPPEADGDDEEMELARLRRVGAEEGAHIDEAVALLRHHQGSARQTKVLHALLEGITDDPRLDPVRVACATLLDERGDRALALSLLEPTRSVPGMMLAAELFATDGNLPRAVSMVERVLARNIDTPGARERHEQWAGRIGRDVAKEQVDDSATVVAPLETNLSFRLVREIARGGAGTIYEAEDELLGRKLAFKVYHRAEQDHAQIEREAQTAVRLAGPGVLRIFDVDPTQGWLAAELVTRGSLRDLLRAGRVRELFPLRGWIPKLIAALGRVHAEGMVHADVKPANVLFRNLTDPVLGDFGVCVPAGTPAVGGTPGYMSPERLDGGHSEARDDVYACGRIIEDVLGARDDAALDADAVAETEEEARLYAKVALACMAPADERPGDCMAVATLLSDTVVEAQ